MVVDLHIHSYYSDGTYSPQEITERAYKAGVGIIAVSDHNTVEAYQNGLYESAKEKGIQLIPSVEIDADSKYGGIHILALGCDTHNKELLELLDYNRDIMEKMSDDLIEKMEKNGENVSVSEYKKYERNRKRGGWKGIDYLFTKGWRNDYPYCMTYYKNYGIKAYKKFKDISDVCRIIHNAGAKAILAHPGERISVQYISKALEYARANGIDGVECYYPTHSEEITRICLDFCQKYNMAVTSGSDCHGNFARNINGVEFIIGAPFTDEDKLNLSGIARM